MLSIKNLYTSELLKKNSLTIKASKGLSKYISHYSFSLIRVSNVKETLNIIPDASGCMVFTFDDIDMDSKVWGATSHIAIVNKTEKKPGLLFMIEFIQGGLKYFSSEYQSDLKDNILELETINPNLKKNISLIYEKCTSITQFIEELEVHLVQLVIKKVRLDTFDNSIKIVKSLDGKLKVKELSNALNYSERQLNRIYKEHLGMNAKTYMQIVKINKVIIEMQSHSKTIRELAHQFNYHDEAHFIKSFKKVCAVTPKTYMQNMFDYYNEDLKF